MEKLWKQQFKAESPETAHDEHIGLSREDHQFMDFVSHSAKRIDGRYHIGLPFRNTDVIMPMNRKIVEQRAAHLQRRFNVNPIFHAN